MLLALALLRAERAIDTVSKQSIVVLQSAEQPFDRLVYMLVENMAKRQAAPISHPSYQWVELRHFQGS